MPLQTIMTAAKTVSRASPAFSAGAATMTETIGATSITVTATARMSVPNGSPVRRANTVAPTAAPAAAAMRPPAPAKGVINRITQANTGHAHAHHGVLAAAMSMVLPRSPDEAKDCSDGDCDLELNLRLVCNLQLRHG